MIRGVPMMLFGIPFTAFSVFWMVMASGGVGRAPGGVFGFFPLFGIPFLLVGLAMLLSPLWMLRKARRTVYVVTDQRAIIFDGGGITRIRSFGPDQLGDLQRNQRSDGSGDLIFEQKISYSRNNHRPHTTDIGFLAIPEVKRVEDLVRELQRSSG